MPSTGRPAPWPRAPYMIEPPGVPRRARRSTMLAMSFYGGVFGCMPATITHLFGAQVTRGALSRLPSHLSYLLSPHPSPHPISQPAPHLLSPRLTSLPAAVTPRHLTSCSCAVRGRDPRPHDHGVVGGLPARPQHPHLPPRPLLRRLRRRPRRAGAVLWWCGALQCYGGAVRCGAVRCGAVWSLAPRCLWRGGGLPPHLGTAHGTAPCPRGAIVLGAWRARQVDLG
jgi:hypothetical protein